MCNSLKKKIQVTDSYLVFSLCIVNDFNKLLSSLLRILLKDTDKHNCNITACVHQRRFFFLYWQGHYLIFRPFPEHLLLLGYQKKTSFSISKFLRSEH